MGGRSFMILAMSSAPRERSTDCRQSSLGSSWNAGTGRHWLRRRCSYLRSWLNGHSLPPLFLLSPSRLLFLSSPPPLSIHTPHYSLPLFLLRAILAVVVQWRQNWRPSETKLRCVTCCVHTHIIICIIMHTCTHHTTVYMYM